MSLMQNHYHFFLAGIIQGSYFDLQVHDQTYRQTIENLLKKHFLNSTIFCPVKEHPNSPTYSDEDAQRIFLKHIDVVKQSHCLIVYLPEASLGSGIEMWEAHHQNIPIVTISPMTANWVVRIFSDEVCENIDVFTKFVEEGKMLNLLKNRYENNNARKIHEI